jgi:putative hydrolase of the HAD superfamily
MSYGNIKAIVFDFWGIFAEFKAPVNKAIDLKGSVTDYPEYYELINQHNLGKISEDEFLQATSKLFNVELSSRHRYLFDADHLNHELIKIIKELKTKYKIGLITNTGKEYMDEFLFKPGLDKLFDCLVISHSEALKKPDPKIYMLAAQRLQLKPEEILYLDDHPDRITPAAALGMKVLLYEGEKTNKILEELL